MLEGHCATFG